MSARLEVGSDSGAGDDAELGARRLGARVRALRHARGLTLVQLAELAELSHPFLSQLERGLARPSFGSLEKIARALGSSQLELLADDEPEADAAVPHVMRADEGNRGPFGEGEARLLVPGGARLRPMEMTGENPEYGQEFTHDEAEFLYVLEGVVEVELDASTRHRLAVGDALYVPGGVAHHWRSPDGARFRVLVVKERRRH